MPSTSVSDNPSQPIPVTMISGFREAGKTALLKYIIENSTITIACVVNDVSDFNVEPKRVRDTDECDTEVTTRVALPDMAELRQGCSRDRLFYVLFLRVAEPQSIRDFFDSVNAAEHPVMRRINLDTMLTVVDLRLFLIDFVSEWEMDAKAEMEEEDEDVAPTRPVADLLVEQVECSDIVVLNHADRMESDKLERIRAIIASLNPCAEIVTTSFGQIPLELLSRSGVMATMNNEAQQRTAILAVKTDAKDREQDQMDPPTPADQPAITSFIYLRRKPFDPERFAELVTGWLSTMNNFAWLDEQPCVEDKAMDGIWLSKGFCWLADNHLSAYYWSHAGQNFDLRDERDWWATVPPDQLPSDPEQRRTIYEDFEPAGEFGDRRQEIIFIGAGMNEEEITKKLDEVLLTDQEMESYIQSWSDEQDSHHPDMAYYLELPKP